jgi:TATA-binding protein-associated factor
MYDIGMYRTFFPEPSLTAAKEAEVLRVGGEEALIAIASYFGSSLKKDVPTLWEAAFNIPRPGGAQCSDDETAQAVVNCLRTAEIIIPSMSVDLVPSLTELSPTLLDMLEHDYTAVRHMACRVMAFLASVSPSSFVSPNLPRLLKLLDKPDVDVARQGALEAVWWLLEKTGLAIVPFVPIFIVPVLKRMSDTNVSARLLAAKCFANLVRLMPLANEARSSEASDLKLDPALEEIRSEQASFLNQLLNPSQCGDAQLPSAINAELRRYCYCYAQMSRPSVHAVSIRQAMYPIDYRMDNKRFGLSAHNCQAPTPTSQNLELEQQIRIVEAD